MADNIVEVPVEIDTSSLDRGLTEVTRTFNDIEAAAKKVQDAFAGSARSLAPLLTQMTEARRVLADKSSSAADIVRANDLINTQNENYKKGLELIGAQRRELQALATDRQRAREAQLGTLLPDGRTVEETRRTNTSIGDTRTARNTTEESTRARLIQDEVRALARNNKFGNYGSAEEYNSAQALLNFQKQILSENEKTFNFRMRMNKQMLDEAAKGAKEEQNNINMVFQFRKRMTEQYAKEQEAARRADAKREIEEAGAKAKAIKDRERAEYNTVEARVARGNEYRQAAISSNGGADFFAFQSQIALNYQIWGQMANAIRGSMQALIEFDDVLARFQAITSTSNSEMKNFRQGLLDIAATSRYSVRELTEASIALGQTGLSAIDVLKALPAVRDLATASGSTLQQSVEAITGVLGAFNMQASRSGEIADILVGALNKTKLTMDQLQLGIQYAGNVARDAGVSFVELTAIIGGIAQAGVKSGSTIGTGTRQLIQELIAPSDKLKGVLRDLGITLDQIDIKSNGLTGVLENLRAKGFTTADALRALDLRAASAFAALVGQADKVKQLQEELLLSTSASEAASKAGESLTASFTRMTNSLFALTDKAFSPFLTALKGGADGITALSGAMGGLAPVLPVIGAGITAIAVSMAAMRIGGLVAGLASLPAIAAAISSGPLLAIGIGASAITGLAMLMNQADTLAERLDKLKGASNEFTSQQSSLDTSIKSVGSSIDTILARQAKLNSDPILRRTAIIEAQKAFGDLGLDIKSTTSTVDELVASLQRLRADLQKQLPDNLAKQIVNLRDQIQLLREQQLKENADILGGQSAGQARNQAIRTFGAPFGAVADAAFRGTGIDPNNAMGSSAGLRKLLSDQMISLSNEREPLQRLVNLGTASTEDRRKLADVNEKIDFLNVLTDKLTAQISRMTNIQGLNLSLERQQQSKAAADIKASSEFNTLDSGLQRAAGIFGTRANDILAEPDANQRQSMVQLIRDRQAFGKDIADQVDAYRERLSQQGFSKGAINEALSGITDSYTSFMKSVTKEMEEVSSSINARATGLLQAQRRENEVALRSLQTQLGAARTPEQAEYVEGRIKEVLDTRARIEKELILLKKTNPDDVANDPYLKEQLATAEQESADRREMYATRVTEARRRIDQAILKTQDDMLDAQRKKILAEADALTKILRESTTTPDKALELGKKINELIDKAYKIADEQSRLMEQRGNKALGPNGGGSFPTPGGAGSGSSITAGDLSGVAKAFLDAISGVESAGKYNIRFNGFTRGGATFEENGQHPRVPIRIEEGYPNAGRTSDAAGRYQFLSSTWDRVAPGVPFTRENQDRYAWKLAKDDYKARTGRDLEEDLGAQGLNEKIAAILAPTWQGLNTPGKAIAGYQTSLGRSGSTMTQAQANSEKSADERAKNEEDKIKRQRETDNLVLENTRRAAMADLMRADKELATKLQADQTAIRKAVDPGQASDLNTSVIRDLVGLAEKAVQKDQLRKDGNTDPDTIISTALNSAQRAAIAAADEVAKKVADQYDTQIRQVQARIATANLPENIDKPGYGQRERDALTEELRLLQEKKKVEVDYAETKLKLAELDKAAAAFNASEVFSGKELLLIDQQREALRRKMAEQAPAIANRAQAARSSQSLITGLESGVRDFGRSRGITDSMGNLVSDVAIARKALSESLNSIGSNFDNFFVNLATGSKKGKEAFAELAKGILTDMAKIASKAVTNEIMKLIFGSLLGGSSGGSTSIFDGISGLFGSVGGKALGGKVADSSTPFRDSTLINAMPGEYVLRKSAVDAIGVGNLDAMNAMGNTVLNDNAPQKYVPVKGGGDATANVYIMERDQQPSMGPNDVVHIIGDDINRGGAIKQLIKKVQAS